MEEMIAGRSVGCRILGLVLALATFLMACDPKIGRAKADTVATARLQQYAKEEGLKADLFTTQAVREQEGKWLYTYEYPGPPKQSVAIIVFVDGRVEVSRMLDTAR